jgi:hypothetical protein
MLAVPSAGLGCGRYSIVSDLSVGSCLNMPEVEHVAAENKKAARIPTCCGSCCMLYTQP